MSGKDKKRKQRTLSKFMDSEKTTALDIVHIKLFEFLAGTSTSLNVAQHPLLTELLQAATRLKSNAYLVSH